MQGVLWRKGKILREAQISTPKNRVSFLKLLEKLVKNLKQNNSVQGIGIACAGMIELRSGKIVQSPNMKFLNDFALSRWVSRKFDVLVKIQNDTNCFLLAEKKFGLAKPHKNVAALTLGTGVGGAVMVDGKLLHSRRFSAAELGHMVIKMTKGGNGTVEDLCSSHFFKRFNLGGALDTQLAAEDGNKRAQKIYLEFGTNLGIALANIVNIFDPELIILGGSISRGSHLFLKKAMHEMSKYTLIKDRNLLPQVMVSQLKTAGALGAIGLFL